MDCFVSDNCKKLHCNDEFCLKKFKMTKLFDLALIPENRREKINLILNENEPLDIADVNSYQQLSRISNDMVNFVNNGYNLFLHSVISGNGKTSWTLMMIRKYLNSI